MSYKKDKQHCIEVDESAHLGECTSTQITTPVVTGTNIVRIPKSLGVYTVTSNLSSKINFPEPVMEIKDIKKRVEIVQCRLMTNTTTTAGTTSTGPFPLLIKGFVRKNIQYAAPIYEPSGECVASDMRSFTTRVPFECMTTVTLVSPVVLPVVNQRVEFDFARNKELGPGHPEKDQFLSSDISQFHQESSQSYNDLPYCELVSSAILEWDESTDREQYGNSPIGEGTFKQVREKVQLRFTVRVLQLQNIQVSAT